MSGYPNVHLNVFFYMRNLMVLSTSSLFQHNYLSLVTHSSMTSSNLSKIKTKLRTQGNVTGNFGKSKVKAGSQMTQIGVTYKENIHITTPDEYLNRLYIALEQAETETFKCFCQSEIRNILIQRGLW